MYTVLIVDNEKNITDSLSGIIDWHEYGFSNILTALNGTDALQILSTEKVHLLITDIKMPQMDGLTLLKHVRQKYPHIHCLILTAYNEFEYAKEALVMGVDNYLLKPINTEELSDNIKKVTNLIFSQEKIDNNIFYNNILLRWLNGSINKEELIDRATLLDINLFMPCFTVLIVHFKSINTETSDVILQIRERLRQEYNVNPVYSASNLWTFIISGKELCDHKIQACVAPYLKENPNIKAALGCSVNNMEQLHISYKHALMLIENGIQMPDSTDIISNTPTKKQLDHISEYADSIIFKLPPKAIDSFKHFLINEIIWPNIHSEKDMEMYIQELNMVFSSKLKEFSQYADHMTAYSYQPVNHLPTFHEFEKIFNDIAAHWTDIISKAFAQYSPIIQLAIEDIAQRNIGDFSTKSFCSKYRISASYFGLLFKKEVNIFIGEYLMLVRINYAINILCTTNKKITEISDMLGFSSPSYFIKCFKKQTGVSPNHYKHFYKNP